jgi:hypothetical protein
MERKNSRNIHADMCHAKEEEESKIHLFEEICK